MPDELEKMLDEAEESLRIGNHIRAHKLIHDFDVQVYDDSEPSEIMVRYHIVSAQMHTRRTEHLDAVQHCIKALEIAEQLDDDLAAAHSMRWLGHIYWRMADYKMALQYLEDGMEIAKELENRELEGILHTEIGNCYGSLGKIEEAAAMYTKAIEILTEADNEGELARAYNNLGDYHMKCQEWEKAVTLFEETKKAAGRTPLMKGWGGFNKAECLVQLKRYDDARQEVDKSIPLLEACGDSFGIASAYHIIGLVEMKGGNFEKAKEYLEQAMEMMEEIGMPVNKAMVVREIGRLHLAMGDKDTARTYFEEAKAAFEEYEADVELKILEKDLADL